MIRNFIVVMLDYMDYITRDINAYRSDTFHSVKFFALYQFVNLTIRSLFYTNTLRNFQVYIIGARFSSSCYRSRKRSFFYFSTFCLEFFIIYRLSQSAQIFASS